MHRDDTKIAPEKLTDPNIAKYCLLMLKLSLSRQIGRDNSLVQKRGKKYVANVYLHYLQTCLKGCDGKFRFESGAVLKETMSRLSESANEKFAKQNLQMEKKSFFLSLSF